MFKSRRYEATNFSRFSSDLHGSKPAPTRILDAGTGNCFSAFALAEMYPEAQVTGVDMSPNYIRFCREWQQIRGKGHDSRFLL